MVENTVMSPLLENYVRQWLPNLHNQQNNHYRVDVYAWPECLRLASDPLGVFLEIPGCGSSFLASDFGWPTQSQRFYFPTKLKLQLTTVHSVGCFTHISGQCRFTIMATARLLLKNYDRQWLPNVRNQLTYTDKRTLIPVLALRPEICVLHRNTSVYQYYWNDFWIKMKWTGSQITGLTARTIFFSLTDAFVATLYSTRFGYDNMNNFHPFSVSSPRIWNDSLFHVHVFEEDRQYTIYLADELKSFHDFYASNVICIRKWRLITMNMNGWW